MIKQVSVIIKQVSMTTSTTGQQATMGTSPWVLVPKNVSHEKVNIACPLEDPCLGTLTASIELTQPHVDQKSCPRSPEAVKMQ